MSQGKEQKAVLVLEDGKFYCGESYGAVGAAFGEIVFTTGMTGYQESLTDPSYAGQILVQTAPHIGNTGVNMADNESARIWVAGYVIRAAARIPSNWRAEESLDDFLKHDGIVGIKNVDTRAITRHIREHGAMRAGIFSGADAAVPAEELVEAVQHIPKMQGASFSDEVSTRAGYIVDPKDHGWTGEVRATMAIVDLGVKATITHSFARSGVKVIVLPANSSFDAILRADPDGVFYSNGPGDPQAADQQVEVLKQVLAAEIPFFGICFGNQLLGRALGFETYKLRYGHRGINQPVREKATGQVEITVHNHGFAVDAPIDKIVDSKNGFGRVEVSHICLNDDVVEGLKCLDIPAFSVQYHPEAAAGPHDGSHLFERFIALMERYKEGEPYVLSPRAGSDHGDASQSQISIDEVGVEGPAVVNIAVDDASCGESTSADFDSFSALVQEIDELDADVSSLDKVFEAEDIQADAENHDAVQKDSRRSPFIVPLFNRKSQVSLQGVQEKPAGASPSRADDGVHELQRVEPPVVEQQGTPHDNSSDSADHKNQVAPANNFKPIQLSYPGQWRKAELAYNNTLVPAGGKGTHGDETYAVVDGSDNFIESLKGHISEAPETIIVNESGGTDDGVPEETPSSDDTSCTEVSDSPPLYNASNSSPPVLPESKTAAQIQDMLDRIQREKEGVADVGENVKESFPQAPFSPPSRYSQNRENEGFLSYLAQAPFSEPMVSNDSMPADAKERLQAEVGNFFDNIVSLPNDGKKSRASRWFKGLRGSKKEKDSK